MFSNTMNKNSILYYNEIVNTIILDSIRFVFQPVLISRFVYNNTFAKSKLMEPIILKEVNNHVNQSSRRYIAK